VSASSEQSPTANPPEFCVNCGAKYRDGAVFCEMCGKVRPSLRSAPPTSQVDWRTWAILRTQNPPVVRKGVLRRSVKAVTAWMMFSVILSLVAGLVTLVYGVGIVAPDILDNPDWAGGYTLFIVVPFFIDLFTISGYALLAYYIFIVGTIIASCAWVFLSSYDGFLKELTMRAEPRKHSQIFDISGLIFVEMFMLIVVILIVTLLGIEQTETGVTGTTSELLFLLANASVWEELIVRVMMIGLPLLIVDLAIRKGRKKWRRYILGGGFDFGVPEIVLLGVSSVIFGCAHYIGGWEAWIVPWDALGGVTFGYLFLRHGLAAAIVLHFAIDYRSMPIEVFGVSDGYLIVLFLLWIGIGAIFTVYYLLRIGEFLTGKKYLEERVQYAVPYQRPMPYPPVSPQWVQGHQDQPAAYAPGQATKTAASQPSVYGGYVCPYCGNIEARWVNGRFQCLRCNRLS